MKKIRCLLVDDEPLAIALLQNHVEQLGFLEVAGSCPNATSALERLRDNDIDLLFLDIRMPKVSGFDLLRTLRNPPQTIITTAYREYALDGYDLDIVDYLLKPITFDRFFKSIERYLRSNEQRIPAAPVSNEARVIYIKSGYKHLKIELDSVLYVESLKDYVKICTREKDIVAKYKISDLEQVLMGRSFLRIHRSFIVNLQCITAFTVNDVELGSIEIPIGDTYREYVFKTLNAGY